eukprot:745555-Rhodomonas_salina.3
MRKTGEETRSHLLQRGVGAAERHDTARSLQPARRPDAEAEADAIGFLHRVESRRRGPGQRCRLLYRQTAEVQGGRSAETAGCEGWARTGIQY